ncbi:hypothetical protein K469DRAFT_687825 [Zopfia rhizophila CBS 207.26]|uniref:Xylanolytic transcriptional activator regulatory domain-containing protein n=1 Tax=Zopfia rhizophila CBS 207.26 TaxID=1314779 RepID=A0A6A6E0L7_9PEZI|nr:hypothetical protein K469DRAFT_687825 [Zopfia rhizophila CBS 207.26]
MQRRGGVSSPHSNLPKVQPHPSCFHQLGHKFSSTIDYTPSICDFLITEHELMENGDEHTSDVDSEPLQKKRRISANVPGHQREVGLMRNLPGEKYSSFVGSASGIYFIRSVYGAMRSSHPQTAAQIQTPDSDIVPGEDDHLPSAVPGLTRRLWRDDEISNPSHGNQCFSFDDLVEWSRSYFANWHPAYPFLHAPAVLEYFQTVSRSGLPSNDGHQPFEMIILRSIMSISLADRRQTPNSTGRPFPSPLVFESYDAAVDSLHVVLSRPASILSLQTAISVQLFLASMLRFNAASRLGGLIIRLALQLGLHRCPKRFPAFSAENREVRQRLFWSLYCIDRSICQAVGLPLSLRDDDIDVCYMSHERHDPGAGPPDIRLRLLEFLARHSEIRGQIMELRNKSILHSQKETDQAVVITAKLTQWWNNVEEFFDSDETDPPSISAFHRTVLVILNHESTISLNRPILAAPKKGPTYNAALQHCIGASRSIITTLYKALKPPRNEQSSNVIHLFWPSCTWAVWMSAFILFHAANEKYVSREMASRLADRSLEILHHLSLRGSVWPEACAAAIRDLRTQLNQRPSDLSNDNPSQQGLRHVSTTEGWTRQTQSPTTPWPVSGHRIPESPTGHSTTSRRGDTQLLSQSQPHPNNVQTENPKARMFHMPSTPLADTGLTEPWTADPSHSSRRPDNNDVNVNSASANSMGNLLGGAPVSSSSMLPQWNDFAQGQSGFDMALAIPNDEGSDPFYGFDIPFWIGQDQYSGMVNEWG